MIGEGTVLKTAAVLIAADLVPKILSSGVTAVVGLAAFVVAAGVLWKAGKRGWRNAREFGAHARRGLHVIDTMPDRMDKIETRLRDGEARFTRIEGSIEVIADANAARVDDALAGDERKPRVDRRARPAA